MGKGSSKPQTTGFRYYFTLLMGIGRGPIDELVQITCGGLMAWDGSAGSTDANGVTTILPGTPMYDNALGVTVYQPKLFGGDASEGGLDGFFNLYMGAKDQAIPGDVQNAMGIGKIPAFRGVTTIMYDGQICANNPYPKAFKFRVRRATKGWDGPAWYPAKAVIRLQDPAVATYNTTLSADGTTVTQTSAIGDSTFTVVTNTTGQKTYTTYTAGSGTVQQSAVPMVYNDIRAMNPAHIIYECCTNRDWGRGLDRALMDEPSFTACANQLYAENFGLCLKWSRSDNVDAFVQSVIDHVGAVVFTDKVTGLLCMRLIRDDYDVNNLPVFDYAHGLLSVESVTSGSPDASVNEFIVTYHSPVLDADAQARAQNIASINTLGSIFSQSKSYPGLPTSDLAILVAQRDLRSMGSGMKSLSITVDRRGYLIVPGDVIIVNAPDQGLNNIIMRVATFEEADTATGTITLTGGQDVFGIPQTPFVQPQQSTFLEPNLYPQPVKVQDVPQLTWRDTQKFSLDATDTTQSWFGILAKKPTSMSYGFDVWANEGDYYSIPPAPTGRGSGTFTPCGSLSKQINSTDLLLHVMASGANATDFVGDTVGGAGGLSASDLVIGSCFLIGEQHEAEYVVLRAVSTDPASGDLLLTVGRGCVDRPARAWPVGSRVWDFDKLQPSNTFQIHKGAIDNLYLLSRTTRGVLPLSAASSMTAFCGFVELFNPYVGANFRLNGFPRDQMPDGQGPDLVFTWNHRNRLTQADKLVDELQADVAPESGTTYRVLITWSGGSFLTPTTIANNLTITGATLAANHAPNGLLQASLMVTRTDPTDSSKTWQNSHSSGMGFIYSSAGAAPAPVAPPPSGWDVNFGSNFGAPA